jgi:hypothetical protein
MRHCGAIICSGRKHRSCRGTPRIPTCNTKNGKRKHPRVFFTVRHSRLLELRTGPCRMKISTMSTQQHHEVSEIARYAAVRTNILRASIQRQRRTQSCIGRIRHRIDDTGIMSRQVSASRRITSGSGPVCRRRSTRRIGRWLPCFPSNQQNRRSTPQISATERHPHQYPSGNRRRLLSTVCRSLRTRPTPVRITERF